MQLQLIRSIARRLELREAVGDEIEKEGFDLVYQSVFEDGEFRNFSIIFKLTLTMAKKSALIVEYVSNFETDSEFAEDFKTSHFIEKNAPAIAFPFIRSYVAHITLIGGYETVILPSVNFTVPNDGVLKNLKVS